MSRGAKTRRIVVDGKEYRFRIGGKFVAIRSPGWNVDVPWYEMKGLPKDCEPDYGDYEENRYGNLVNWNYAITPSIIENWIRGHRPML